MAGSAVSVVCSSMDGSICTPPGKDITPQTIWVIKQPTYLGKTIPICLVRKVTRVPTRSELNSLLPKNQEIPGTYIAGNGEKITATLHVGEGTLTTPTGVTGTQHYVKFTSEDTGRYLIIPLAGGKGDKSTTNNPSFGKRAVLGQANATAVPVVMHGLTGYRLKAKEQRYCRETIADGSICTLRCVKK